MLYTLRFFSLQNAVCFIMLTCLVPVLFIFHIHGVLKFKKWFRSQRVKHPQIKEKPCRIKSNSKLWIVFFTTGLENQPLSYLKSTSVILAVNAANMWKYLLDPTSNACGPRELSRYSYWLRDGRSGDRKPGGGEIFRTRPDQSWGPPSLLYNVYRVSFPG
jgi:hypothetical protein